jgi:hypothetical protein
MSCTYSYKQNHKKFTWVPSTSIQSMPYLAPTWVLLALAAITPWLAR